MYTPNLHIGNLVYSMTQLWLRLLVLSVSFVIVSKSVIWHLLS